MSSSHVGPSKAYGTLLNRGFYSSRRSFIEKVIKEVESTVSKGQGLILVAPTGIGKTAVPLAFAVASQLGYEEVLGVAHVMPLKALIDDVGRRICEGLSKLGVPEDACIVAKQYSMSHQSPFYAAPYVATTADMYFLSIAKIPVEEIGKIVSSDREYELFGHYELPRGALLSYLNVLDEAHLIIEGHEKGMRAIAAVLKFLAEVGTPFVLMTATLPDKIVSNLVRIAGQGRVKLVKYSPNINDEFYRVEVCKKFELVNDGLLNIEEDADILEMINEFSGRKAIVVNTVERAVRIYEKLGRKALLLHSRFTIRDREEKLEVLSKTDIVITTQVIEAGVDVSFDVLISELAPISNLVQRFGRLARGDENLEGVWGVFYDVNSLEGSGIYDRDFIEQTFHTLSSCNRSKIHWHLPMLKELHGYEELINSVWSRIYYPLHSVEVELMKIFRNPLVSSKDVIRYLMYIGNFLREDNYLPIYLGEPPSEYAKYLENVETQLVPTSSRFALKYACRAVKNGVDVGIIMRDRGGFLKVTEFKCLSKQEEKSFLRKVVSGSVLSICIPRRLYDGGVGGIGLKPI